MTIVVDASFVVAALVDSGPIGQWAECQLIDHVLAAPHLVLIETANILRRAVLAGDLTDDAGALVHSDLIALRLELFGYEPFAERVWELRNTVTAYDAWYIAVAESFGTPLATLDVKLSRAPGPRCEFWLPPTGRRRSV